MSADLLERAAAKLREMSAAALEDLRSSRYYGFDPANFGEGIDNACGGAAGELAALFSPVVAEQTARTLEQHADEHSTYDCDWAECPTVELARAILGDPTGEASNRSRGVASDASPAAGPVQARTGPAAPGEGR